MVKNGGFIAKGVYSEDIHVWDSNSHHSKTLVSIPMFNEMLRKGYIRKSITGQYYPTDKGRKFAAPWYKKVFNVI